MAFKEDFQEFVEFLKTTQEPDEMKKAYRKILMEYHPDHAAEKDKELYNEYILLINKAYAAGRTKTKETEIKSDTGAGAIGQTYVFTKIGPDGKTYSYKCRNYFDYLYKVARNEYDIGHQILHFHNINYLDKKALDQNSLEVMQHYWNSIKCYKFLLKNCHDPVILSTCEFELKMVQDAVNVLARTIISSDDTGLMMV